MRTALVAGLGLIGGAVGIALRQRGWRVHYLDPHVSLEDAQRFGAADDVARGDEDIVVIATPVDVAVALLPQFADRLVTSVCSVMRPLRAAGHANFVAGHPMTGHHASGLANAPHVQLDGATWFVDADGATVNQLVRDCGSTLVRVDAAEHDAAVALTSHLPQVLSTALFAYLSDKGVEKFAGGGLKSFRLAASDGAMWHSVLAANRDHLRPHADAIAQLVRAIIEGDEPEAFARAAELWRRLSQ